MQYERQIRAITLQKDAELTPKRGCKRDRARAKGQSVSEGAECERRAAECERRAGRARAKGTECEQRVAEAREGRAECERRAAEGRVAGGCKGDLGHGLIVIFNAAGRVRAKGGPKDGWRSVAKGIRVMGES